MASKRRRSRDHAWAVVQALRQRVEALERDLQDTEIELANARTDLARSRRLQADLAGQVAELRAREQRRD